MINNYKYDLINLAFLPYSSLILETSDDKFCIFPTKHERYRALRKLYIFLNKLPEFYRKRINRLIILLLYLYNVFSSHTQAIVVGNAYGIKFFGKRLDEFPIKLKVQKFDLEHHVDTSLLDQAATTFLCGWQIRCWNLVKKHEVKIRASLSLEPKYMNIANKFIQDLRQKYNFLIGVLIRQNDYARWLDGKFYFTTEQYIEWIVQAAKIFENHGKVGFIIAADQPQNLALFQPLNAHFSTGIAGGSGHYLESMVELSRCDIIMTPPSTFSAWSGFMGNTPLLPLYKQSQVISRNDLLNNHLFDALEHHYMSFAVK